MSVIISSFAHVIIDLKLFTRFLFYQEIHKVIRFGLFRINFTKNILHTVICTLIASETFRLNGIYLIVCVYHFFHILEPLNLYDDSIKAACPKMEYKINIFTPRFFIKTFFLFI